MKAYGWLVKDVNSKLVIALLLGGRIRIATSSGTSLSIANAVSIGTAYLRYFTVSSLLLVQQCNAEL